MFRLTPRDLAVDLGTANTLVYEKGKGIVLNEPSFVTVKNDGHRRIPIAFGAEAKVMMGRTPPELTVVRPVRTGVIADFDVAGMMLQHFLFRSLQASRSLVKPRVVVGVPQGITEVERRAIRDSIQGAASVSLISEAMAAAVGVGLPVLDATASMIVDIGGGTTDVAVLSLGDIVSSLSLRQGGDALDDAIINHMRRYRHMLIGDGTAERIKKTIGCATEKDDEIEMEVRGRSLTGGGPAIVVVTAGEIREAIQEVVSAIVACIRQALENTPPELAGDIISTGIVLSGGGALLKGLAVAIEQALGISVALADDPVAAVVTGAGKCLEDPRYARILGKG